MVVSSHALVGIHCWASWNQYDYLFAQEFPIIAQACQDSIDLYALDVEDQENRPLPEEWHVLNVPAFVVYSQGVFVRTFYMGRETVIDLRERIIAWLRKKR
jgi:hypothetical protein